MIKAQYDLDLTPAERLAAYGVRRAIRIGANRAAAKVKAAVVTEADRIALTHAMAKSIRIKVKVYPGDRYVSVVGPSWRFKRVGKKFTRGPRAGQKRTIRPAAYGHLVNAGTRRSKAKPWLTLAHAATHAQYLDDVRREVGREIELELQRRAAAGR